MIGNVVNTWNTTIQIIFKNYLLFEMLERI